MGGVNIKTLLDKAYSAGLRLRVDGELLRINGPRKATRIAKALLDRRREVVEILKAGDEGGAPIVEVDFYDGRRIRIPQRSTPEGWEAPF